MKPNVDNSFRAGHRERLRQKFIDGKLTDYEFLELLLMYAIPRRDVRMLARGLFCKYGGVHQVVYAPFEELAAYPGMGKNSAVLLKLSHEMMKMNYKAIAHQSEFLNDRKLIDGFCRTMLASKPVEECHVLYLGHHKKLLLDELHSHGDVDWTAIYPNQIVQKALALGAKYIIMVHNHPSGVASFSQDDVEYTQELVNKLRPMGIAFLDHYIVAGDIVVSCREKNWLKESGDVADDLKIAVVSNT